MEFETLKLFVCLLSMPFTFLIMFAGKTLEYVLTRQGMTWVLKRSFQQKEKKKKKRKKVACVVYKRVACCLQVQTSFSFKA